MHPCLHVPEIIRMICEEIRSANMWDGSGWRTLFTLTHLCRVWSEIVLDSLWDEMNGLGPLVMCMPKDLWHTMDAGNLTLERPVTRADLEVLHKYTPRVRIFRNIHGVEDNILQPLLLSHGLEPLLPNLQKLDWSYNPPDVFPYIPQFLVASLETLDITIDMSRVEQLTLFLTIPTKLSPNLSRLNICFHRPPGFSVPFAEWRHGLFEAVGHWRGLVDLCLTDITLDGLLCIASLPGLAKLQLMSTSSMWLLPSSQSRMLPAMRSRLDNLTAPFPVLQSLNIAATLPTVIDLLKILHGASLIELRIRGKASSNVSTDHLDELFRSLERHCNPNTLLELHLDWDGEPPDLSLSFSTLAPLLRFPALQVVDIQADQSLCIVFSEQQMEKIASSWPNLQVLVMNPNGRKPPGPSTTLLSLIPLARYCPNLRRLKLYLDASNPEARKLLCKEPERHRGIRNRSLIMLGVGRSPVSHKEFLAMFLQDLFPNLNFIECKRIHAQGTNANVYDCWQYISRVLLPLISEAKRRDHMIMKDESLVNTAETTQSSGNNRIYWTHRVDYFHDAFSDPIMRGFRR